MYTVEESHGVFTYFDGQEEVSAAVPAPRFGGLILPRQMPPARAERIQEAFAAPLGTPRLRELASGRRSAVVLVSDATRAVPTSKVVPMVMEELKAGGISPGNVTFIVATGVHRPATNEEMAAILGPEWIGRVAIENHDPYGERGLVHLGDTSLGTPVWLNRKACSADLRVAIGKVEPHEFAGFSGGRKSVLPGIASERTIRINHRPEMILHPLSAIGVYRENPIGRDMAEAARMLGIHFSVNILVDSAGNVADIVCGELEESHRRAVEILSENIAVSFPSRVKILVTTPGHPLNINLYQSIKCIIAAAPVMEDHGVIVVHSACAEGVGSADMLRPFENAGNLDDVVDFLMKTYEIQMDHSLLLAKILQRGIRIVFSSPCVEDAVFRMLGMIPARSLEDGVRISMELSEPGSRVLFFPCPQRYLPRLTEGKM